MNCTDQATTQSSLWRLFFLKNRWLLMAIHALQLCLVAAIVVKFRSAFWLIRTYGPVLCINPVACNIPGRGDARSQMTEKMIAVSTCEEEARGCTRA